MKKIYFLIIIFMCKNAAANTDYLSNAATSWGSVNSSFGNGAVVSSALNAASGNTEEFYDIISAVAYNDSAMNIFEVSKHLDNAFFILNYPSDFQKKKCAKNVKNCENDVKKIGVFARGFFGNGKFESDDNAGFETNTSGANIIASGLINNNLSAGFGLTHSTSKDKENNIIEDGTTNSLTAFLKYYLNGFFINLGTNIGITNWDLEKAVSDIKLKSEYETNFFAVQMLAGKKFGTTDFFASPEVGLRYTSLSVDEHTDSASQKFDGWMYNAFSANTGLRFGTDFSYEKIVFEPSIFFGAEYDISASGDDLIQARLMNNTDYFIPIITRNPFAINGSVGFNISYSNLSILLDYELNSRGNFMSHTVGLNLKLLF